MLDIVYRIPGVERPEEELEEPYGEAVADVEGFTGRSFDDVPALRHGSASTRFSPVTWSIGIGLGGRMASGMNRGYHHELAHAAQLEERGLKGLRAVVAGGLEAHRHGSRHAFLADLEGFAEWVQSKHGGRKRRDATGDIGREFYRAREELYGVEETVEMAFTERPGEQQIRDTIEESSYGHVLDRSDYFQQSWCELITSYY